MPEPWMPAVAALEDLTRAAESAAVLRAAVRAGVLDRLRTPSTVVEIAAGLGADEQRLSAVLAVLECLDVARRDGAGTWALTAAWSAVLAGESPFDLPGFLQAPRIRSAQFDACLDGTARSYGELTAAERLAIARGVSFDPASPAIGPMLRRDLALLDGLVPALDAGGTVLELGCGVGSRLTALALAFALRQAVGIELDAELVAFGRDRAAALGLAGRVSYVVGDATTYEPEQEFDLVNWSQFFFPSATRAGAMATAWRALRPGGWVTAPVIFPDDSASLEGAARHDRALAALDLSIQGVPPRTTGEVAEEFSAAGFAEVRVDDLGFVHAVRGRRPPG